MASTEEQDPYKYFKNKFQGQAAQGAGQDSHTDSVSDEQISATDMNQMEVAQDKFDEAADTYSMNDDDFQLSGTHNNKTMSPLHPRTPGTVGRASVLTEEQKAEKAKRMAEEEFRRIQAQIDEDDSSSTPSQEGKGGQKGYDYFLAKQKKEAGEEESSEHDDYSRASDPAPQKQAAGQPVEVLHSTQEFQIAQNEVSFASDKFEDSNAQEEAQEETYESGVPLVGQNQNTDLFSVHDGLQNTPGNSTVNKGSVVPQAVKRNSKSPKSKATLQQIDEELKNQPSKFSPANKTNLNKRPKTAAPKRDQSKDKKSEEKRPQTGATTNSKARPTTGKSKERPTTAGTQATERPRTSKSRDAKKPQEPIKKRPETAKTKHKVIKDTAIPSHVTKHKNPFKEERITNLQISHSTSTQNNDISAEAKKNPKFEQAKKAKDLQDKLTQAKKGSAQAPGRKQRPAEKAEDPFGEASIQRGDECMPTAIKPQKLAPLKPVPRQKVKPVTDNKPKKALPSFKMLYKGPMSDSDASSAKPQNKDLEDFAEQSVCGGDEHMPVVDFAEESIGAGDENIAIKEVQTPVAVTVQNVAKPKRSSAVQQPKNAFGSNPNRQPKPTQKELLAKGEEDFAKFKQLQKNLKAQQSGGNAALNQHMAAMQHQLKLQVEQQRLAQVNPVAQKGLHSEKYQRKPIAENPYDQEGLSKEVQDASKELKQLFFENKLIQSKTQEFEKLRKNTIFQLENIMKENDLIRVNGQLQHRHEPSQKRRITSDDIPDYDKVKTATNPLESVVQKFEALGWSAEDAFVAFDFDCDEVLTIEEIKDGCLANNIILNDSEWKKMHEAMDANHDGILTCEEWQAMLEPKIVAQRKFLDIMKGVDINDPLDLEERILDIQFQKRRLDNEVRLMRRQKQSDMYFKNAKVKEQHKVVSIRIRDLEQRVKANQHKNQEAQATFLAEMQKQPQSRADLEAEMEQLTATMHELEIKYAESQAKHEKELFTLDQRFRTVNEYAEMTRQDRQIKQIQLKTLQKQLENDRQAEIDLDKEVEGILGRAVTQADLDDLYAQDMKILAQIEAGFENKIESYKQIIAAMKLQKVWRGKLARNKHKTQVVLKEVKEQQQRQVEARIKESTRRKWAAILIQRAWRRRTFRLKELERLKRRNDERRAVQEQERQKQREIFRDNYLVKKLQRFWRQRREARKQGTLVVNPFKSPQQKSLMKSRTLTGVAEDTIVCKEMSECALCGAEQANRMCKQCDEAAAKQCDGCFKELHKHGHRKRHTYARLVTAKHVDFADIPERDSTFGSRKD